MDTAGIIKAMLPELPELPEWPKLSWTLEPSGRYSLSEADVDKVLDYWENQIPRYRYELEVYGRTITVIVEHL